MPGHRLVSRLRRHFRMRVMLALSLVALAPLLLLVLLEKAMTGQMSLSFSTSLVLAIWSAVLVGWVADRRLLRPMLDLAYQVVAVDAAVQSVGTEGAPPLPANAPGRLRMAESLHLASRQLERDQQALESAHDLHQRLTREIHHRVKNNLQIIVSLLNLHQRGAGHDPAAAGAFCTIQQRVEALTAVHRNLVASAEVEQGIALSRPLDDLVAIFQDSGPDGAPPDIRYDAPGGLLIGQDAALPAAFLPVLMM